ncbi:MAG: EamA family transporter [bacterium]
MARRSHQSDRSDRESGARRFAIPALLVLALIWGYAWVVMKISLDYVEPLLFAAMRSGFSAVVLLLLLPVLRRPLRCRALGLTALLGLLQTTGFAGLVMGALQSGGAGKTSVLVYTMPFWLLLMAWAVLGERLRGLQWLAFALAMGGMILILGPWRLHGVLSSLLAIGGGFCWAASATLVKVIHKRHAIDILSLTAWQMLLGAVPLAVIALLTSPAAPVWSPTFIWALAYNVLLANGLAWVLWLFVLRALPATTAGVSSLIIPVIGVVLAWAQLGERPGPAELAGMTLIVIALGFLSAKAPRKTGAPATLGLAHSEGSNPDRRTERRPLL